MKCPHCGFVFEDDYDEDKLIVSRKDLKGLLKSVGLG